MADLVINNSRNMNSALIATVTVIVTFTSWISISFTKLPKGKQIVPWQRGSRQELGCIRITALVLSRGAANMVGDDTRLTENRNARSVQLLVLPTEPLTDWEWLPGELLSGSEGLAGLDMKC